jgi:hypothetical protein
MDNEIPTVVRHSSSVLVSLGIFMAGFAALIAAGSIAGFVVYHFSSGNKPQVIETSQSDFQIVQLGQMRRDQFLIDRRTGRVWTNVCSGKVSGADCNGMMVWEEMYVDNVTPTDSPTAAAYRAQFSQKTGKR